VTTGQGDDQTGGPKDRDHMGRYREPDAMEIITTLQDVLLPSDVPVVPGLDLDARYLLTPGGACAGDWFDVVLLPEERVALVVGDVVGHGVAAAAAMGQLRAVLHSQLVAGRSLQEAMDVMDQFGRLELESHATTVCVVLLETATGHLEYCTAGHPPPLVCTSYGETRYLAPSGAAPLATSGVFATAEDRLDDGDIVVLYTDGLVGRPGRTMAESTVELAEIVGMVARSRSLRSDVSPRAVGRVCETGIELLTQETGYADDITVLAAQRRAPGPAFFTTVDARLSSVPAVRDAVSDWLAPLEISGVDDIAVRHAVGELVTNAVLHAHADEEPAPHSIDVDAQLDHEGVLSCRVRDDGHWREHPGEATRNLGLGMVAAMVDDLKIERNGGTTAAFRHRLTRTAQMLTGGLHAVGRAARGGATFGARAIGNRVVVRGDVDAASADQLRGVLSRAWRGGIEDVVVDLSALTSLGSAGVHVLWEAYSRDETTTLLAPMGSVAQQVLDLVHLPYEPDAALASG
jgi:anti-anti-sigma factor